MTVTRQISQLEQEIAALGVIIEQYKDEFALPQGEAELLVSCYGHIQALGKKDQQDTARYAAECAVYYRTQRDQDFFNDAEIGRRIFAEVTQGYVNIQSAIEETK